MLPWLPDMRVGMQLAVVLLDCVYDVWMQLQTKLLAVVFVVTNGSQLLQADSVQIHLVVFQLEITHSRVIVELL